MSNSVNRLVDVCKKDHIFAFLDVETTGLSVELNDRICEIAILKYYPDGTTSEWQTLVNPCREISYEAAGITHISNEMVASAPKFREVAKKLLKLIEDTTIVCHNAKFDLGFVQSELKSCNLSLPDRPVLDTLKIARDHFTFPSNSLGKIAAFLEIDATQAHRALADVCITHKVFQHMVRELTKKGIEVNQLTKSCLVY